MMTNWHTHTFYNFKMFKNIVPCIVFFFKEETVKMRLNEIIREYKKLLYNSLTEVIEENMKDCYQSKIRNHDIYTLVV